MSAKRQTSDPVQPRRPRGRPKTEDLAALEARLILVGRQLFFRHGYGATAMSAVAEAARVSKTTLYARFPSKAALFRAIVGEQMGRWDDDGLYHTPMPDFDTLEEVLRTYGEVVLRAGATSDFIQLNRLMYSESGRFPELAQIAEARFGRGRDYLTEQVCTYADREGIPCRDPRAAADVFLMALVGRSSVAILGGEQFPPAERMAWLNGVIRSFLGGRSTW